MVKRTIAIFEVEKWEEQYIKKFLKGHTIKFFNEPISEKHIPQIKNAEILSVFIYSKVSSKIISKLSKLKLVSTRSTGFDHIDLKQCKKKKITVSNVPFYGENTVAEHTFALILSLSRNVHKAYVRSLKSNFSLKGLQGFDLKGKTIGVIGGGHIGLRVIKMAKGFGMNALVYDLHRNSFLEEVLQFKYASLEELLSKSDIISLHAPYNPHTHHLINKENIKKVKKGALLINTARGGLVDTDALIYALETKILSGAGLDVLENEDQFLNQDKFLSKHSSPEELSMLFKNENLLHRDNVVITPHLAFDSEEALKRILDTTVQNIQSFIKQIPQSNEVKIT